MEKFERRRLFGATTAILLAVSLLATGSSAASTDRQLYVFQGGNDGSVPQSRLARDTEGNLYGATANGGGSSSEGTVFEATPPAKLGGVWTETVLHNFSDYFQGQYPLAGLVRDTSGNLYGTTWLGGNVSCTFNTCGVVFELSPPASHDGPWNYSILHSFSGPDGAGSRTQMIADAAGNLYGTTAEGGAYGYGVVFEVSRSGKGWNETVLYSFPSVGNGPNTYGGTGAPVTLDAGGNLYGTAFAARGTGYGGAVFELRRPRHSGETWRYRNLYRFQSLTGGVTPEGGVTFDAAGNLYGTTRFGGTVLTDCAGNSCGTVFRLAPTQSGPWTHTLLHAFTGMGDGAFPQDTLTVNASGTEIYGTTPEAGSGTGCGCGVLFELTSDRHGRYEEHVLHTFRGNGDGYVPVGGAILGVNGLLYGLTEFGGSTTCDSGFGCGTVYAARP